MKNIPEKIFLNISEEDMDEFEDFNDLEREGEVTWCNDKVHDTDIEYVVKKSPWISVKDQLPANDNNVFYTNYLSEALGVGYYIYNQWYQAYTGEKVFGVTHYMPIPTL